MEKKSAPEGVSALQAQVAALTELLAVQEKVVGEQSARLEQALRERDELLNRQQQLIENLPACIFLKDSEMRYVAVNPAYHRLLPHGVEDPVGKRDRDVFPAKLANGFEEEDRKVLREGQTIRKEEPIRLRDGRVVQMSVSLSPVRGVDGTIVGLVGFAFDVTEHRRAEQALHESEEKFRKISS